MIVHCIPGGGMLGGMQWLQRGACMVARGVITLKHILTGVCGCSGACVIARGGACMGYDKILEILLNRSGRSTASQNKMDI